MADRTNSRALPNVSNELIASFAMEADLAQRDIDEASGRKRAVLKRASRVGIRTKTLLAALSLRKGDPDEALAEFRDLLRYATVVAPQIDLSQGSLFDALDIGPLNETTQNEVECWNAHLLGYDAGIAGDAMDDTAYETGSEAHSRYHEGYSRGSQLSAERRPDGTTTEDASGAKARRANGEHNIDLASAMKGGTA